MFFNDWIQRRLATILRPWLIDEPELELKLGLFRSNGTLSNISFNTSALNKLLDDPSKFCFKEVTVEQLILKFSPFSSASFILVVRGVRVVLSLGEEHDEVGVKWRRKPKDNTVEEKNKILQEIDPEGCAFHDDIKRISDITTRTWRSSLWSTVLRHCQLQLLDINVLLRSPTLHDPLSCSLHMKKLGAGSQNLGQCFTRRFMSSFFLPSEESLFEVDVDGFEIRSKRQNSSNYVLPATSMLVLVYMNNLQFTNFCFRVPALNLSFSPHDLGVVLLFYGLFSKAPKCVRSGRQLWNTVSRTSYRLLPPKLCWIKLVKIMSIWLRYIKIYQSTLTLVGYPVDENMRRSASLMFRDARYSRSVKSQLNMIEEIENELPVGAIISARRIIRAKVASSGLAKHEGSDELLSNTLFSKLCLLLVHIISGVFYLVSRILFLHNVLGISPHCGSVCDDWLLKQFISLNIEELSLYVFPDTAVRPFVTRNLDNEVLSFQFSLRGVFLRYTCNISEKNLIFSSGCLEVLSSAGGKTSLKRNQEKDVSERQIIIWNEPAQTMCFQESTRVSHKDDICGISLPHLDKLLGKMWLNWKDSISISEEENTLNVVTPWILWETTSFLTDQGLISRFWGCSLVVGKLNVNLDYLVITSIAVLLGQIQHALLFSLQKRKTIVLRTPKITTQGSLVMDWRGKFRSLSSKCETDTISMLLEKNVEIGVLIAGPHVQISLFKDQFNTETDHKLVTQVAVDICDIEFLASPSLEKKIRVASESTSEPDGGLGYRGLEEPHGIGAPNSDCQQYSCQGKTSLNLYLKFNGLKAYLVETAKNQKCQIVVLSPITIQLSYIRKDHHSFGSSIVALSASFCCVATGFTGLIFLDELCIFTKMIGVFNESLSSTKYRSSGGLKYKEPSSASNGETSHKRGNGAVIVTDTEFYVRSTFEVKSFDLVIHNSRTKTHVKNTIRTVSAGTVTDAKSSLHDSFGNGFYITVVHSTLEVLYRGGNSDVMIDLTGARSTVFRYLMEYENSSDKSELRNILSSLTFLTEASVSHCKLCLRSRTSEEILPPESLYTTLDASSSHGKDMLGDLSVLEDTGRLGDHWLLISVIFSGIYMAGGQIKNILINENNSKELHIAFSAGGDFQTIACQSKGGSVLLEAASAVMFTECLITYYHRILELWQASRSSEKTRLVQYGRETTAVDGQANESPQIVQRQGYYWDLLEVVSLSVLHLSLTLVARDESGGIQEILFEVDLHFNLERSNAIRKISMNISKFSVLSCVLRGATEDKYVVVQNPAPFHAMHVDSSTNLDVVRGSNPLLFPKGSHIDSSLNTVRGFKKYYISPQNYILKNFQCSVVAEGPMTRDQIYPAYSTSIWVGNGSVSGLDITLSLSEINMMLSAFGSVSEIANKEGARKEKPMNRSYNPDGEGSNQQMVADGTIVAIQDIDQHMYIAVGSTESIYDICGAVHYSLVGERSLFRVKYHNSRWKSQVQYFSLISLYAKDEFGEPLRLNCHPRSRLVAISCPNDGGSALWRTVPSEPDAYEQSTELEPFQLLSKKTFHLVNKKNDCALAFNDGALEFVSKPGNLFKWNVFGDAADENLLPDRNSAVGTSIPTTRSMELRACSGTGVTYSNDTNAGELGLNGDLLGITVTMDKVTLTIVDELSDTEEKFPLLQGSITLNPLIVLITNSKMRFISTFEVAMYYFDAHRGSWSELIQPFEICTFYSFKFLNQTPETSLHGVPSHLYLNIREVTILVNELSLDVILSIIGKLDLAGPYAVKGSVVMANSCKVDNQCGLPLSCQFYDHQNASVSARQSITISRHLASGSQSREASSVSVQLVHQGSLSTSPLQLSLLEARKFAWRTRIVSSQDSKSYPGPFIVMDISRKIKDGLSIVASPLLRIYNETDFSLELRFQRPHHKGEEYASLMLKAGDVIDDSSAAFSAISLSGELKKALTSLSVGNYVFSFRPDFTNGSKDFNLSTSEWSDDLKGGKPVRLSGIFDKLSYQVRKTFLVDSVKVSLSSAICTLKFDDGGVTDIHFLIQTVGKDIPVINPDGFGYAPANKNSPVAVQEQKEVFVLPTVQVSNLLHSEIHVNLADKDSSSTTVNSSQWSHATVPCGSTKNFYANPATIIFTVTLTSYGSSCRPVNSSDWVKKLQKKNDTIRHLDIELEFCGGKYFAMLRLSRGENGTLKAVIFTPYTLQNSTNASLFCFAANQKSSPRVNAERYSSDITPDLGSYLPPDSTTSWFLKCHKMHFKLLEQKALVAQLDLDALSGLTEIDLEAEGSFGSRNITRLGVSLKPSITKEVSSQIVYLSPRYVVSNESEEKISIRQCYIEDTEDVSAINSKQRIALTLKTVIRKKKEINAVEKLLRKHTKSENDLPLFIQFKSNDSDFGWSGPICVASLGRFFLKFRKSPEFTERQSYHASVKNDSSEFAAVHVVEEGSTIVLHFYRPPHTNLPYRIENSLRDSPVTYYQKGSLEPETLGAEVRSDYVWDDLTLPHKLVVQLDDVHLLREINLDKVRSWKPFHRNNGFHFPRTTRSKDQKRTTNGQLVDPVSMKMGYEVYAEGMTRVLRICELSDSHKVTVVPRSSTKMRLRVSYIAIHLQEQAKQETDSGGPSSYAPIIITRLEKLNWDSMFTEEHKYNQIRLQSLSVDEKWDGAPFTAMLRRRQMEKSETNYILHVAIVLLPQSSGVRQVKYLSIALQPLDLNLDEETLMKIVPFWRSSLSDPNAPRQQYYFDHFEIHPIKIVASFLPGDSLYSYSSTQETLRSLLHSVIKIPAIKSKTVELNGVLVTHALITLRDLSIKCAQHYSWYSMRAIYIAKGSPLLPPAFASLFDDLASSSLDAFFDPSSGGLNLPGVTLGTLKLISKFIDNKGFSGTKRYFGDLGKTLKTAGSNIVFAAVTEVSDSILNGAERSGFNGMLNGFHQGILKLAMEPSVLSNAFMEGGPDRKIKLDRSPGVDELYIEGYLQAMLDTMYKQEYLRVRVIENQVVLKNLPPSSSLIEEIMARVKDFLASKALLKGGSSISTNSLRHIRGEREWKVGPTVLTLCEHLFVSFAITMLRNRAGKVFARIKWKDELKVDEESAIVPRRTSNETKGKLVWQWGIGKFFLSGIVAYVDGRLCRNIPHPIARRIVSGFLLSFLDNRDNGTK